MDDPASELRHALEETTYLLVGFGILGVQRAQVRRRAIEARIRHELAATTSQLRGPTTGHDDLNRAGAVNGSGRASR